MVQSVLYVITNKWRETKEQDKGTRMKKIWEYSNSKWIKSVLITACAVFFFLGQKNICFAETTGKVTVESAKVRQEANVTSEVIGSSAKGATVTITNEVTDSSGTVWYEVYVDANTKGYIRSDLISKDGSSESSTSGTTQTADTSSENTATQTTSAPGAESQPDTGMDAQYATVSVEVAKVRSGASTDKAIVDSIPKNTSVVVSGQTDDSSNGKTWYYITFTGTNGAEKTGYIRSDLVQLGDMVPVEEPQEVPEEQPAEEPVEEQQENKDYEVVYTTNENGEYEWYLYNNVEGNRQKLEEVLAAAHAQSINDSLDAAMVSKQRIIIIILIAVIIILAVVMTIMIFKLRDAYYEEYEDDEDEEEDENEDEEEEERPVKKAAPRKAPAIQEEPVRKTATAQEKQSVKKAVSRSDTRQTAVKEVRYEEEPAVEAPVKTTPKRKAKNFLIDDDDFEFEFLNMNDKDL